jgi:AmmeMemoRadiSam system protein A
MQPLVPADRRELLSLARASIRHAIEGGAPPVPTVISAALSERAAAFVSLHQGRMLRGCIGTLTPDQPLYQTVREMALAAAFGDPRFPPLALAELDSVAIEISRLSALVPARPEDVCPGRHGVCIAYQDHRGVFLPQVASMYSWDRERLLTELCRKADLLSDTWKQPDVSLMIFEAEVFGEDVKSET